MAEVSVREVEHLTARIRRTAGRLFRDAPATLTWLGIIIATSIVQSSLPAPRAARILHHTSTNLKNLLNLKVRVLATSAFWLDSDLLFAQLVLWTIVFIAILAPAERWLGTKRWLVAVLVSHVGATIITAARLWLLIKLGRQPGSV